MVRFLAFSALALVISLASVAARVQQKQDVPQANAPAASDKPADKNADKDADKDKPHFVTVRGHPFKHSDSTGLGEAQNIEVIDDQTIIKGDTGTWNDKKKTAQATGHLTLTDPEADGTCDKAEVFYAKSKRLLILTGNVTITVKPKEKKETAEPAPKPAPGPAVVVLKDGKAVVQGEEPAKAKDDKEEESPRRYPAEIKCDRVEYQYDKKKKIGHLTGHFKVVQKLPDKERTLTADHGEWFGLEEKVILHPPVHFEDTKGTKGDSTDIVTVFTKEGEDRIEGGKGQIQLKADEEEEETKPTKKPEKKDKK